MYITGIWERYCFYSPNCLYMAKLVGSFLFTGSIDNLTAYKRRDSDKIIVRKKGGPSKERIKNDPKFDLTRRTNKEFGGRALAGRFIMQGIIPYKSLGDYNVAGPITALVKPLQELDTKNSLGQRSVLISANARLLEGFNISRHNPFDSVIINPLHFSLSKETGQATIEIPAMLPGINFMAPGNFPLYKIVATLTTIPDIIYNEERGEYQDTLHDNSYRKVSSETSWIPTQSGSEAMKLALRITPPKKGAYSLMLFAAIAFGTIYHGKEEIVKYTGSGKILGMA